MNDIQIVGLLIWSAICLCACVIGLCMGSRSIPPPVPRPSNAPLHGEPTGDTVKEVVGTVKGEV